MTPLPLSRLAIALWGVLGVELILGDALWRLLPRALAPFFANTGAEIEAAGMEGAGLEASHLAVYAVSIVGLGFFEGYRGFQQAFAPRVAARAMWLAHHPRPLFVALAPLFVMALFHATRRRVIASWMLIVGIVALIVAVHQLPPLYRSAVDSGVVVGLTWGAVSVLASFVRALLGAPTVDPELPARDRNHRDLTAS